MIIGVGDYQEHPEMVNGNVSKTPSAQSLKMEKSAIKEILEYALLLPMKISIFYQQRYEK